jgi:hypothetical protein
MKRKIIALSIPLIISACGVPQDDYNKLKLEKEALDEKLQQSELEISNLQQQNDDLLEEKRQIEIEKNKTPFVTESQALDYIKDYYNFYDSDVDYRNVRLRRLEDNVFTVSLEECTKKGSFSDNDFFWTSRIKRLTVNSDGTYKLQLSR